MSTRGRFWAVYAFTIFLAILLGVKASITTEQKMNDAMAQKQLLDRVEKLEDAMIWAIRVLAYGGDTEVRDHLIKALEQDNDDEY